MRYCRVTKNVVCRCRYRYTLYHNQITTTLTKTLA